MTFEELSGLYATHLQTLQRKPSTVRNSVHICATFIQFCASEESTTDPRLLTQRHLARFVAWMRARGQKPSTVYNWQRSIKTWLHWATLRGYLLSNPVGDFHVRPARPFPRGIPSEDQVELLLSTFPSTPLGRRDRALVDFLYSTGLRRAECSRVDLADLALPERRLRVACGKGEKPRELPFGPHLADTLTTYLDEIRPRWANPEESALWVNVRGGRLQGHSIAEIVRAAARQAALAGTSVHSLRHAYATHQLQRGMPLPAMRELLGHESCDTTALYTHLVITDVKAEHARTHPRARKKTP